MVRNINRAFPIVLAVLLLLASAVLALGDSKEIPHGQSKPVGPALTPQEAMARMILPPGFKVDLVASEPDIVNPTSFTFDERGRIWITESVEYPRESAGPGQDRVKILESTHHDGKFDKVTVFKDGLNIPCGVTLGNGGVYVTNSPDVLFLRDTQGTGHADKEEVILTGFGRDDRHELPNSLTWGPDGWLYGMNGVFNRAHVVSPSDGKAYDFTCGIWRYQPRTKKFELFSEGTSNPWGLDYNRQGDWFVSCCVIDHLFHMSQSGYYLRQGGPYPPLTHWLASITTQHHQQRAYGGLCIYDADAFPEEYRGTCFMGNLHGSCINRDTLTRNGATYVQHNADDFLQAGDAWFMPVSEKIGPDGCLYIMDWYDRYHCYQDANRDAPGIDRTLGRIYRISYNGTSTYGQFDLAKASDGDLLKRLDDPNVWWRRTAQRILHERFAADRATLTPALLKMAMKPTDKNNAHMHALWLLAANNALDEQSWLTALKSSDEPTRNWGVRAAGLTDSVPLAVYNKLNELSADPSPDVRAQVAIAAGRLGDPDGLRLLETMLLQSQNAADPLIPTLIYNNLKPMTHSHAQEILDFLAQNPQIEQAFGSTTAGWIRQAINTGGRDVKEVVADMSRALAAHAEGTKAANAMQNVLDALSQVGVRRDDRARLFNGATRTSVENEIDDSIARGPAVLLALWWADARAEEAGRKIVADPSADAALRSQILKALAETNDAENIKSFSALAFDSSAPILIRQSAVDALGSIDKKNAAELLTDGYKAFPADLKPMAINALTHSIASADALLDAVAAKSISTNDVTVNHVRQILGLNDKALSERVTSICGKVKTERDPERVKVVERMRKVVTSRSPGDVYKGRAVFNHICAQCHSIYGSKQGSIGPDLTGAGRENLDAVLTNVLDPSLVIGAPYFVYVARTRNGDTFSGILAEKSDKQIVLKDTTKQMVIPTADIEKLTAQNVSMMPEGLEKAMSEDEFVDLVAFLLTREPPAEQGK